MRIHLLDPLIANQIAAGEVIERPASIVKELLENSLDANANKIEIDILQGGLNQICVSDNGCGIYKDDLPLAIARHGTSKISKLEELDRITTLGFRGEALASMAAVSQLILTSCPIDQDNAWQIEANGMDKKLEMTPTPHPKGTRIILYDLFCKTPARRKFMRSEKSEFLSIQEIVKRMALSHFHVKFNLIHNHRRLFSLPSALNILQQEQRMSKLFGKGFLEHAFRIDATAGNMYLYGWLTRPQYHRAQANQQYFYINKRAVRDKLINHAIRQVYHDKIAANRHPAYILFLEIDAELVDVNVHPTKQEVRFRQARLVHDFLVYSLKQTFHNNSVVLSLETEAKTQANQIAEKKGTYLNSAPIFNRFDQSKPIKFLFCKYLLLDHPQTITILDIQQLLEQFLIALLQKKLVVETIRIKPLLIPLRINIIPEKTCFVQKITQLFKHLCIDIEIQLDRLIIRAMPEILYHIAWEACIEKLNKTLEIEIKTAIYLISQVISQEYKIPENTPEVLQSFLQAWLCLDDEARHICNKELSQIDIARLFQKI